MRSWNVRIARFVRLYKYFTYKNTFSYIDVLSKFGRAYNDTVHSTTVMATSHVTHSDILAIWRKMRRRRIHVAKVKFNVGQHVRISKEEMKFAKGGEQFLHRNITDYESYREASTTRSRAGGFKQTANRGRILRGGTDSCSNLEPDHLQDR